MGGHLGAKRILALVAAGTFGPDGEAERQLVDSLAAVGIFPYQNMEVLPGVIGDLVLPEASLICERDGAQDHSIHHDVERDRARDAVLHAEGWAVERISAADMRNPGDVTARIARLRLDRIRADKGRPAGWKPVRAARGGGPPNRGPSSHDGRRSR